MEREQRQTLLLVRWIGLPFGLNSASPLQNLEAISGALHASSLSIYVVALALELLVRVTKRLDLNEKWSGHVTGISTTAGSSLSATIASERATIQRHRSQNRQGQVMGHVAP